MDSALAQADPKQRGSDRDKDVDNSDDRGMD